MGALVAEVGKSYSPLFVERRIALTVVPPETEVVASFDRDRVVQVLSNLLGNALKFTPGGGAVELRAGLSGECVEFAVRDTGLGIDPKMLPHVFERFSQLDVDTRRGLGLGLYICEHIVQRHGGRIWVESAPGKGTTVRFTVPIG